MERIRLERFVIYYSSGPYPGSLYCENCSSLVISGDESIKDYPFSYEMRFNTRYCDCKVPDYIMNMFKMYRLAQQVKL